MSGKEAEKELKVSKRIVWEIPNFTRDFVNMKAVTDKIDSTNFVATFGNTKTTWFICCYPNGNQEMAKGNISLFLHLVETSQVNLTANVKFAIVGKSGDPLGDPCHAKECLYPLEGFGARGYSLFISHDLLFKQDNLVVDNKLTIMCELNLFESGAAERQCDLCVNRLAADYEKFFETEMFCDLELRMQDGKTLKANTAILAARSDVFFNMLSTEMTEKSENVVEIDDVDSITMKELLRYVYCDKVNDLEAVAKKLIYAADKYQLGHLKQLCCEKIASKLTKENVIDALIIADRLSGTEKLFQKCIDLVVVHYSSLLNANNWKNLPADLLVKVCKEAIKKHCYEKIRI